MDCGIALEGGGARGAYHIGAVKALLEKGYNIKGVVGTSIGSINAAVIAQGDFDLAYDIWKNIKYTTIFKIDENKLTLALKKNINLDIVKYMSKKLSLMIKNGGIDTGKIREFLNKYIDEDKLRNSNVLFGLVTFSLTEKKAYELYLEDIPDGKLHNYIMASSRLPVFKQEPLDGKYYMDGGVYNNCPINMLVNKNFKNIIAIKTRSIFRSKDYKKIKSRSDINLTVIEPRNDLPNILSFDSKTSNDLIVLGYYDALKVLDNLDGFNYYFNNTKEEVFLKSLFEYDQENLNKIYASLKLQKSESKKILLDTVIPILMKKIKFKEAKTYKDVIYALVEYVALKENIEKFKVYDFQDFLKLVKTKIRLKGKNKVDEIIYRFVKNLDIK